MKGIHYISASHPFKRGFFLYWLPTIAFAAVIFVGSSLSSSTIEETIRDLNWVTLSQELLHAAEFGIFALLIYRLLWHYTGWPFLGLSPVVLVLTTGYGALDELHQAFVPGRDSSLYDLGWDALGAVLALSSVAVVVQLRKLRVRGNSLPGD